MQLNEETIRRYDLSEEEMGLTMSGFTPMIVRAGEFFLQAGEVSNHIGYVVSGLLRSFAYDDHANEITSEFYPQGTLIIAFDSFNQRVPSREHIKAIEDSELMVISHEKQMELYEKVPAWNQICKDLADAKSQEMMDRANQFRTMSATERYRMFCKAHPGILLKANLGYIASYIGVDIATLSRIRKKK